MRVLVIADVRSDGAAATESKARNAALAGMLGRAGMKAVASEARSVAELRRDLASARPDLVFCAASHLDDGRVVAHQAIEDAGLPYVGSPPRVIELALAKDEMKARWMADGIPTPPYFVERVRGEGAPGGASAGEGAADFPYIVKPCREGDSRGIDSGSVVKSRAALRERVARVAASYGEVLVERYLGFEPGFREYTAALVGSPGRGLVAPIEVSFPDGRALKVVTHEDKARQAPRLGPIRDGARRERVVALARAAFASAGVRDYARCDIVEARGELYAIEVNGQPMMPDLWFDSCAAAAGLSAGTYPAVLVLAAVERLRGEGRALPPAAAALRAVAGADMAAILLGSAARQETGG